ncbi:hypothetical protein [Anabaena sp. AL93]|uniref:hypothetical protein n=1 Tax=Anabaena sp. AL93 TaxID=1678133 RepID=UPI0025C1CDD8|nr:hypothetical protein [Anabaena sp. AL93]
MKRYSQLADLESLLLDIDDENIRAYAAEAIVSYSGGAYRSAIVSIWIAVVYDLYQKFRYLAETFGDPAAKICLKEIDKIRTHKDKKQVAIWERTILSQAFNDVKMLTSTEYNHLDRIQEDRHRCAHPVLDTEGFLFQPTPELVRTHIRTAIEVLLSQPPVIGKALSNALERDVEGKYFPDNLEGVRNFLIGRHLPASEKYITNLFIFCLKKILLDEPDDKNIIKRYMLVFECILEEHQEFFKAIDRKKIVEIIDKTKEDRYIFLSELFFIEQEIIFDATSGFLMEKLKSFATENHQKLDSVQYLIMTSTEISEYFIDFYSNMKLREKINFIHEVIKLPTITILNNDHDFITTIFKINLNILCDSSGLDDAEKNSQLIYPFLPILGEFLMLEEYSFIGEKLTQLENKNYMNNVINRILEYVDPVIHGLMISNKNRDTFNIIDTE